MFGERRIYYNNFAGHLLNAYNPNMLHLGLPYRWSDHDWRACLDMIAGFGFNAFEFWLEPRLFCREGLSSDYGAAFTRQMRAIIDHAHTLGLDVILLAGLATVGSDWTTLCPNEPDAWSEIQALWQAWARELPGVDGISIFPGDPGACSRNGCTAETYIDRSIDIAHQVKAILPQVDIELGTWGPPFFGWGNIQGPPGWRGEFIPEYQHTAWDFDAGRAERSMEHLLRRLPDFPKATCIAINLGFNSDGIPRGEEDARPWARELARTNPIHTWDFSLTEGENAIVPHFRLDRLFAQRRREREAAPYRGGICFTMTPLLNQLSLYASARSFLDPDAVPLEVAGDFCARCFGEEGRALIGYLPLFEVLPDWGNYSAPSYDRVTFHQQAREMVELLHSLKAGVREDLPFHPSVERYRQELLFHADFLAAASAPAPDYDDLYQRYWERVYAIYDQLPEHIDPRPRRATRALVDHLAALA